MSKFFSSSLVLDGSDGSTIFFTFFFRLIFSLSFFYVFYFSRIKILPLPHTDFRILLVSGTTTSTTTTTTGATATIDTGTRRRLWAGFRPLSGLGRVRLRSTQHRSISLPESKQN